MQKVVFVKGWTNSYIDMKSFSNEIKSIGKLRDLLLSREPVALTEKRQLEIKTLLAGAQAAQRCLTKKHHVIIDTQDIIAVAQAYVDHENGLEETLDMPAFWAMFKKIDADTDLCEGVEEIDGLNMPELSTVVFQSEEKTPKQHEEMDVSDDDGGKPYGKRDASPMSIDLVRTPRLKMDSTAEDDAEMPVDSLEDKADNMAMFEELRARGILQWMGPKA